MGYPIGGDNACVTVGVVSRIDMQRYNVPRLLCMRKSESLKPRPQRSLAISLLSPTLQTLRICPNRYRALRAVVGKSALAPPTSRLTSCGLFQKPWPNRHEALSRHQVMEVLDFKPSHVPWDPLPVSQFGRVPCGATLFSREGGKKSQDLSSLNSARTLHGPTPKIHLEP